MIHNKYHLRRVGMVRVSGNVCLSSCAGAQIDRSLCVCVCALAPNADYVAKLGPRVWYTEGDLAPRGRVLLTETNWL